ncbi:hypothetical protein MPER_12911 [Moniliophthora perniciosa FA553]|nr:hypothetical protein MPER_12911 [Moniliophthora perniciosa FA553]
MKSIILIASLGIAVASAEQCFEKVCFDGCTFSLPPICFGGPDSSNICYDNVCFEHCDTSPDGRVQCRGEPTPGPGGETSPKYKANCPEEDKSGHGLVEEESRTTLVEGEQAVCA